MKLIIAGSRNINKDTAVRLLENLRLHPFFKKITEVVSGGARGVDRFGEEWAHENNIVVKIFHAEWEKYSHSAGPIRNREMAAYADACFVIWDGVSNGTKNMLHEAKIRNIPTFLYIAEKNEDRYIQSTEGDVLELAPKGSFIVHAVNCMGVWGNGIAKQIKEKYPKSFKDYRTYCSSIIIPGDCRVAPEENGHRIVSLFTSKGFGAAVDNKEKILLNTRKSLESFVMYIKSTSENVGKEIKVYSNQFNSGLFNVPWSASYNILNEVLQSHADKIKWTVCKL